jgi:ABC-type multidrug transport system permease subunit
MSFSRFAATFGLEFSHAFRRPLFIMLAFILALSAFGLSSGAMQISSGDSSVGGTKAWITSEFAQTQMMTFIILLYYGFFLSIAAGLALLKDREMRVDVLLQTTSLRPAEYVLGRFAAVFAAFAVLLFWQVLVNAFFNHAIPNPNAHEMRGPFLLRSYVIPVLTLGLPFVFFFAGISMYIGERTRSAILVFVLPIALLLVCGFFLWTWSPSWLDWRLNQLMQVLDPSGYRWLNETHLKVDRGVAFYNTQPVPYDGLFWINRLWMVVLGLGALWLTIRSVATSRRGVVASRRTLARARTAAGESAWAEVARPVTAGSLGTRGRAPSFVHGCWRSRPPRGRNSCASRALHLHSADPDAGARQRARRVGAFDTPILLTPGITAVAVGNQITTFACLLLMFYTVESLERERTTGLASILYSTPIRTGAYLFGKAIANSLVAVAVLFACLVASAIALAVQGTVSFSIQPYLLVWGLLIVPTFLAVDVLRERRLRRRGESLRRVRDRARGAHLQRVPRPHGRDELGGELAPLGRPPVERPRILRDRSRRDRPESRHGAWPDRALHRDRGSPLPPPRRRRRTAHASARARAALQDVAPALAVRGRPGGLAASRSCCR